MSLLCVAFSTEFINFVRNSAIHFFCKTIEHHRETLKVAETPGFQYLRLTFYLRLATVQLLVFYFKIDESICLVKYCHIGSTLNLIVGRVNNTNDNGKTTPLLVVVGVFWVFMT